MSEVITCIEDLRVLAKRRVPKMFYDYADSGSWTEGTYRANEADFQKILLRQRVAVDMSNRTLATTMVGQPVSMPIALSPVGMTGMQHADGEILAARAASAAGIPFTLSTMSICSIEDVAENTDKPFWFQLYVMRDKDFVDRLIGRAKSAGCSALVLTLDLQILAQRHKDLKNGLSAPPKMTLANIADIAGKPALVDGHARHQAAQLPQHRRARQGRARHERARLLDGRAVRPDAQLGRRQAHQGPLGRQADPEGHPGSRGCELAARSGADALIVSNHGGRQLDGAQSSISALPEVVKTVGDRIEVLMDGGIRSGQDVIKALALGAKGVMIGRPYIYGLGAMGQAGVTTSLDIIRKELDMTMALCGLRDVKTVDSNILLQRNPWPANR